MPVQMVANYDVGHAAAVAIAFLDSGHMQPEHWQRAWQSPIELCERAVSAWWREKHPAFEVLPALYCHVSRDDDEDRFYGERPQQDRLRVHVGRRSQGADVPRFFLKRRIERLERACPGLGFRALHLLDLASIHTVQALTPWAAFGMASWVHWQGANDEREALAMYHEEGETDVDIYTRAQFLAEIPEAAIRFDWRVRTWVPPRGGKPDPRVMARCNAIVELARSKSMTRLRDADLRRADGGAWVEFGAVARWSARDDCMRLADDWFQAVSQDETWETFGSWDIPLETRAMRAFFADLEAWLKLTAELDAMLVLLGDRE
jgi:PRTRC genetic system protein F